MWRIKVLIQFVLSKLPKGEELNYQLQKANRSHDESLLRPRILKLLESFRRIEQHVPLAGATVVEIGTGWEPVCSLLIYLLGARTCHTYDHVPHVRLELAEMVVRAIAAQLDEIAEITTIPKQTLAERVSRLQNRGSLEDLFARAGIVYHAPGDATETGLPDNSVDLVYSHAVLEHVPQKVIHGLTREARRVLRDSGCAYHLIGLHDHYISLDRSLSKVNFLRYSEFWWSFWVKNRISYHNRLREKQFLEIFAEHGAGVAALDSEVDPADVEALRYMKIDTSFRGMTPEELAVHRSEVILSFRRAD